MALYKALFYFMQYTWDDIFGQEKVKTILNKIIHSDRVPNSFLFAGIGGIGKEFTAIRFTQLLNIKADPNISPKLIKAIEHLNEPYLKYIMPLPRGKNELEQHGPLEKLSEEEITKIKEEFEKKSNNPYHQISIPKANNIKINSIRDIKKFLSIAFEDINFRTVLISNAHLMSEAAQNALLKSLEEPPRGIIFILCTPYPSLLRETIRSRCWQINFSPLSDADVKQILIKYYDTAEKDAESAARFSGGSITAALYLLENDPDFLLEKTIVILRNSFGRKINTAYSEFEFILKENNSQLLKLLIQLMLIWMNDVQKQRLGKENIQFNDYLETMQKFNSKFPDLQLKEIVKELETFINLIDSNVNINLVVINLIFELGNLTNTFHTPSVKL